MSLLVEDLLLLARLDQGRPLSARARRPGPGRRRGRGRHPDQRRGAADHARDRRLRSWSRATPARLRQIVDNLLQNAVVHTPPATPVHVDGDAATGRGAVVRVADEGPGLEAEQAAHVFDRFYRGNEARTGEGTGLGLSIVAALADAHGGTARVETAPGAGSVFVVEIPARPTPTSRRRDRHGVGTSAPTTTPAPEPRVAPETSILRPPFVVDRGRGAPVLFVHGQPGLGSDWDQVAAAPDRSPAAHRGSSRLRTQRRGDPQHRGQRRAPGRHGDRTRRRPGHRRRAQLRRRRGHRAGRQPPRARGRVWCSWGRSAGPTSLNVLDRLLAAPVMGEVAQRGRALHLGPGAAPCARPWSEPSITARSSGCAPPCPTSATTGSSSQRGRQVWKSFVAEQRSLVREIGAVESALGSVRAPTVVISGTWDLVVPPSVSACHRGGDPRERARERGPHRALRPPRRARGGGRGGAQRRGPGSGQTGPAVGVRHSRPDVTGRPDPRT